MTASDTVKTRGVNSKHSSNGWYKYIVRSKYLVKKWYGNVKYKVGTVE